MYEKKSLSLPSSLEESHDLIRRLVEITDALVMRVEKLEQENRALKERLDNNSSNSSLPPLTRFQKEKTEEDI